MLNKNELRELIAAARQHTTLTEVVIEKDYYVTRAISIISQLQNPFFQLVFSGGTCLAKAHRIVKRMSEDIDFKLHLISDLNRSQQKKEIKAFREAIFTALSNTEFKLGETKVKNEGRYISIYLDYPSLFDKNNVLRPHLLLEFTFSSVRLPTVNLEVSTLIQDLLSNKAQLDTCGLSCVSVIETLAEKWVGLTRRIAAIERGYLGKDDYLIRHLHDIAAINFNNPIGDDFYALAQDIVRQDSEQFKTQHPEYFNSPSQEINYSLDLLDKNSYWQSCYENFIEVMVFEKSSIPDYKHAMKILRKITHSVIIRSNC